MGQRRYHKLLAGADEAGRGAWAGPLVAAAVILPQRYSFKPQDSKKLSAKQRERLFVPITRMAVSWTVSIIEQPEIDRDGIQAANLKALRLSLEQLPLAPDSALVDGLPIRSKKIPTSNQGRQQNSSNRRRFYHCQSGS
jgi:ribonuclease HII